MRLACSLLCLAACTKPTTTPGTTPTTTAAASSLATAAENTSIAAARALRVGDVHDFLLPCGGEKLYFGPVAFAAENDRVAFTTTARSTTGEQVCGGGNWIDRDGAFVAVEGVGCVDSHYEYTQQHENVYTPAAGGTAATPQYLELHRDQIAGAGCATLAVHLVVKAAPGAAATPGDTTTTAGGSTVKPTVNPTLGAAAEAAQRDRVLAMLLPTPRDGGARRALLAINEASAINDTTFAAQGASRADIERALDELKASFAGAPKDRKATIDAFAARWSATFTKLRAASGLTSSTKVGDTVSIRDCVRDGKVGPSTSKVEIRDCVRDKNVLYRALSSSGGDATRAQLAPNGVFSLSKLLAKPGKLPATTPNAPPFDTAGSRDDQHGFLPDPSPYVDVRGVLRLPTIEAKYAENKHADAFASKSITTGDQAKTVIAQIGYGVSAYAVGLGYATTGIEAALVVTDGSGNTVCSDKRQDGIYGPAFAIAMSTVTAPAFVACRVPAHTTGTITVGVSVWSAAGGFAYAGQMGGLGSIGLRIVDDVTLTEL